MPLSVRALGGSILVFILLTATSCGGKPKYAGLTQDEATILTKERIESKLLPGKSAYHEVSIWNIAAVRGENPPGKPVWVIGIWNGQSERGECALASRLDETNHVRLIPCATFPKYAR